MRFTGSSFLVLSVLALEAAGFDNSRRDNVSVFLYECGIHIVAGGTGVAFFAIDALNRLPPSRPLCFDDCLHPIGWAVTHFLWTCVACFHPL